MDVILVDISFAMGPTCLQSDAMRQAFVKVQTGPTELSGQQVPLRISWLSLIKVWLRSVWFSFSLCWDEIVAVSRSIP